MICTFEIRPCRTIDDTKEAIEQCEESEAEFWTVYEVTETVTGCELRAVDDCETRAEAEALLAAYNEENDHG